MKQNRVATVFGGTGFIGHYIVARLAAAGWQVRIPTRNPAKAADLRPMGDVGQVVPMATSLRSDASLAAAVKGADVVINLLGILHSSRRNSFRRIHAELPGAIARAATAACVGRFIQISAIGASTNSQAAYARTKAEGEQAARAAFPGATVLRPSVVFGPEDDFLNRFAGMTRTLPFLPLIGGGATKFQPVYAGDVADAVMAAIDDPAAIGQTYELGGPNVYTFKEIMQKVLTLTHRRRALLNLPFSIAKFNATFLGLLPKPPLTRDQVELLKSDNIVASSALTFRDLGLTQLETIDSIAPLYLARFIPGGMVKARTGRT